MRLRPSLLFSCAVFAHVYTFFALVLSDVKTMRRTPVYVGDHHQSAAKFCSHAVFCSLERKNSR